MDSHVFWAIAWGLLAVLYIHQNIISERSSFILWIKSVIDGKPDRYAKWSAFIGIMWILLMILVVILHIVAID